MRLVFYGRPPKVQSIPDQMGRDYYEHPDQLMTYLTLKGPDIAEAFGGVGE